MVDEEPVLLVLPGAGQRQPEKIDLSAGTDETRGGGEPDHIPAEGDHDVGQACVPAEADVVGG